MTLLRPQTAGLLLLLTSASAWAAGGPGGGQAKAAWAAQRALPPTALDSIQEAFAKAPPWKLKSARIETSRLVGVACTGDARCFDLIITDPREGCAGHVAGPWCITWSATRPVEADKLEGALGQTTAAVWIDPVGTDGEPSASQGASEQGSTMGAWSLGLALILAPIILGWLFGLLLRRWRKVASPLVATASFVVAVVLFTRIPVSFWDLLWLAVLFSGGVLLGAFRPRARPLLFSAAMLVVGMMALEAVARLATKEPATYPSAASAHFVFRPSQAEAACYALDRDRQPPWVEWRRDGHIRAGPRVIHLGDSMVFGTRVEGHEAFVNELEHIDPGVAHVNFGVPYSSTDAQYMALMTWIDQVHPARVILHFYAGNDIKEMDRSYPCCELSPFLQFSNGVATPRCKTPRWRFDAPTLIAEAPPPYVLRLLTSFSWSARHSMEAFEMASAALSGQRLEKPPIAEAEAWEHLEIILRTLQEELRARQVDFRLVVLPDRTLAESPHPDQEATNRIREQALALAVKLHIPAIDPLPFLRETVAREGSAKIYVTPPAFEIHLNAEGHRRYAHWLLDQLGPALAGKAAQ